MSDIGQPERATQNPGIALFRDELGHPYAQKPIHPWESTNNTGALETGPIKDCSRIPLSPLP